MLSSNFRMPQMLTGNPFFPTPDEVSSYLGLPTSFRERAKLFAESLGVRDKLPSDRTLDHVSKRGVRWNTIRPFVFSAVRSFYRKSKFTFKELKPYLIVDQPVHVYDIGFYWRGIFPGMNMGLRASGSELDVSVLEKFISDRSENYKHQFYFIKERLSRKSFTTADLPIYYSLVLRHTLLTGKEQYLTYNLIANPIQQSDREVSYDAMVLFLNDFWLSLMAAADYIIVHDHLKQYQKYGLERYFDREGILSEVFGRSEGTYLGKLFGFLQEFMDEDYSKLARYVPLPLSNIDEELNKRDAQIERFKEWRSGKTVPSVINLINFFDAMGDEYNRAFDYAVFAIFMRALDGQLSSVDSQMKHHLSRIYTSGYYQRYYRYHKRGAI